MTHKNKLHQFDKSFEKEVFNALKYYGFKLPKTDEEVEMYVRMFGSTKIELPKSMTEVGEIFDDFIEGNNSKKGFGEIIAIAAQGDKGKLLPEHIVKKIKMDIKNGKFLKYDFDEDEQRKN